MGKAVFCIVKKQKEHKMIYVRKTTKEEVEADQFLHDRGDEYYTLLGQTKEVEDGDDDVRYFEYELPNGEILFVHLCDFIVKEGDDYYVMFDHEFKEQFLEPYKGVW